MQLHKMMDDARREQGWPELEIDWATLARNYHIIQSDHGFLAAMITDQYILMHGVPVALEIAWYVEPDYRNNGEGMDLYKKFESWAYDLGVDYVLVGRPVPGATKVGPFYLKELV